MHRPATVRGSTVWRSPRDQAHAVVDALEHRMTSELATKADIAELRTATKADLVREIGLLRTETKAEFIAVRTEIATLRAETTAEFAAVRGEISTLRAETKADLVREIAGVKIEIAKLDTKIEVVHRKLTIQLGSMMVATAGTLFAALKYL